MYYVVTKDLEVSTRVGTIAHKEEQVVHAKHHASV